jgi:cell division protein ZipA
MEDLRLTFLIFGIVAIVAILVHGLWTIRKNAKGNEKAKFESRNWQNKSDPSLNDEDQFDANGVSSVRMVSPSETVSNDTNEQDEEEYAREPSAASHSESRARNGVDSQDDAYDAYENKATSGDDVETDFYAQGNVNAESGAPLEDAADVNNNAKSDNTEKASKNDLALDDELSLERTEMDFAKLAEEHEQVAPKLYGSVVTQPKPGFQRSARVPETSHRQSQNQDNPQIPEPPPFLLKSAAADPEVNPEVNEIAEFELGIESVRSTDPRGRVEPEFKLDAAEAIVEPAKPISLAAQARKLVSHRKKSVADVIRKEPQLQAANKLNEEQMRIDFSSEEPSATKEPSANKEPSAHKEPSSGTPTTSQEPTSSQQIPSEQPTDVLVLNIRAPEDREITGAALLPMVLTLGLKFGEQDIFHRHVNTNGKGPVLFSLANLFKPGVFDIDNIETFSTRGLSLFMMLPIEGEPQQVFNMMHNAARKLADEFSCQILDGSRGVLTKQGLQKYSERIREFERKRINR